MKKERLVIINARLAFAMPADADPQEVYDTANMMLVPLQRIEGADTTFIDYSFGDIEATDMDVTQYDYDVGFS